MFTGLAVSSVSLVSPSAPAPAPGTSPPVFTSPPKTELKSLGSRVELDCRAEGSPAPAITWTRNGEVILSSHWSTVTILSCDWLSR